MKNDIETTLIEVDIDGEDYHLEMMDGSVWYVNPGDLPTIATWMPTSQIEIVQNEEGGMFCYEITNMNIEDTITAMKVAKGKKPKESKGPKQAAKPKRARKST